MASYDRYVKFRSNNEVGIVPFVKIPVSDTDYYEEYNKGVTRLDKVSYEYYGNPDYGWLILQANPEYGALEFNIPDKAMLRIPFPLDESLEEYRKGIDEYNKLYK